MEAQRLNQATGLQAGLANQASGLQAGLAAQQMGLQGAGMNAQFGMQAQLANQQAQQNMYNRQLQGLSTQYGGNLQSGLQTQNLGMTAQQLADQSKHFGAGLNLQTQAQQEQARTAMQNANLGYLNFQGNQAQNIGNWQTQDFNNNLNRNAQLGQTATNQQGVDQGNYDRLYKQWQTETADPYQRMMQFATMMSMMPQQGTTQGSQTGSQTVNTPGPGLAQILTGLLATGIGGFTQGVGGGVAKNILN
jgi:hypothetical protein